MLHISSIHGPDITPQASMIWMHGLGAQGDDMAMLVEELHLDDVLLRHVFVNAPLRPVTINNHDQMPAWYDIVGSQLTDREDEAGILQSAQGIGAIIAQQIAQGIAAEHIYLAGFSQGGAMALHTGLHYPQRLAGIICLSGYLPLASSFNRRLPSHNLSVPIFLAAGQQDPIVHPEWALATKTLLEQQGCHTLSFKSYPMEHCVCKEELHDLTEWIRQTLRAC